MSYINYPSWLHPEIIPGLPIRWYSLMYIVAFVVSFYFFMRQVKTRKLGYTTQMISDLYAHAFFGLIIGARLFYAFIYAGDVYLLEPWKIFWPFYNGRFVGLPGMSYHGGLIGATCAIILYCRRFGMPIINCGDMIVASVPFGYVFGRLGNFANKGLYGKIAQTEVGMLFPNAQSVSLNHDWVSRIAENYNIPLADGQIWVNLPRHASQLYEASLEGVVLGMIFVLILSRFRCFPGFYMSFYLMGYAIARFICEYFREPDQQLGFIWRFSGEMNPPQIFSSFLDISMGQILSLYMFVAGVLLLIILYIYHRRHVAYADETYLIDKTHSAHKKWHDIMQQRDEKAAKQKEKRQKMFQRIIKK